MIEMIQKKQWSRLSRNVALVVMLLMIMAGLPGCAKTVVGLKEGQKARPDPSLMVAPRPQKELKGTVSLPKHLRDQAAERRRTALKDSKTRNLQGFVEDSQKSMDEEK